MSASGAGAEKPCALPEKNGAPVGLKPGKFIRIADGVSAGRRKTFLMSS